MQWRRMAVVAPIHSIVSSQTRRVPYCRYRKAPPKWLGDTAVLCSGFILVYFQGSCLFTLVEVAERNMHWSTSECALLTMGWRISVGS